MENEIQNNGYEVVYVVEVFHNCKVIAYKTFESKEEAMGKMYEYALAVMTLNDLAVITPIEVRGDLRGYQMRACKGSTCHFWTHIKSVVVKA